MADIYGRSAKGNAPGDIVLSKYATRDELADLVSLSGVDRDEVVVFQDQYGRLKTSNINCVDIILRVSGSTNDNIRVFTLTGKIRDSSVSIAAIRDEISNLCL